MLSWEALASLFDVPSHGSACSLAVCRGEWREEYGKDGTYDAGDVLSSLHSHCSCTTLTGRIGESLPSLSA